MKSDEFDQAAVDGTPVRLKDRSACYYTNEWYLPGLGADGERWIETHTGENHDVDEELLEKLRTAGGPGLTNNALVDALAFHGGRLRIVVATDDGGYDDLVVASEAGEMAVESRSDTNAEGSGYHGPASEARGCEPTETVIVLRRMGHRRA